MKERSNESETRKEAEEKAARARRRKLRKERDSAADADYEERPSVHKSKGPTNGGDKSSDVVPRVVSKAEKRRLKTVITQDNFLQMVFSDNPEDAKIAMCDEHYDKLVAKIERQGLGHLVSKSEDDLKAKVAAKKIDPLFHATEALIRLSLNTIGSEGVVQYRCPVCALSKFDFISQIATYMRQACLKENVP